LLLHNAEMAPCLAKLIEDYLDEFRDQVHGIDAVDCAKGFQPTPSYEPIWERCTGLKWPS
jgi:hypothetical protein